MTQMLYFIWLGLALAAFAAGWPWPGAFLLLVAVLWGLTRTSAGPTIQPPPERGPPDDPPSE